MGIWEYLQRRKRPLWRHGFTILELLVTVGVIGLLAALSSTLYEIKVGQARKAEPKLTLPIMFSLEKAFYSEYGAYIADFDAIGYMPEGYRRFFATGWATCTSTGNVTTYSSPAGSCFYPRVNIPSGFNTTTLPLVQGNFSGSVPSGATVDPQVYQIYSSGQILKGVTQHTQWWIKNDKKIGEDFSGL